MLLVYVDVVIHPVGREGGWGVTEGLSDAPGPKRVQKVPALRCCVMRAQLDDHKQNWHAFVSRRGDWGGCAFAPGRPASEV